QPAVDDPPECRVPEPDAERGDARQRLEQQRHGHGPASVKSNSRVWTSGYSSNGTTESSCTILATKLADGCWLVFATSQISETSASGSGFHTNSTVSSGAKIGSPPRYAF